MKRLLSFGLAATLALAACNDQPEPTGISAPEPEFAAGKAATPYVVAFSPSRAAASPPRSNAPAAR